MEKDKIHVKLKTIAQTLFRQETMDIGLISGKMSAVIFYFHYARFTGDNSYNEAAMVLLDEIQSQLLFNSTDKSYRSGLAGIGIAFDYLVENGFVEVEEDFLDDIDKALYAAFMSDPSTGFSLYDGLIGHAWYWLCRTNKPYSEMLLSEILSIIQRNSLLLSSTELFDYHNLLFELNCLPVFGQRKSNFLKAFRRKYFLNPDESYPRLTNSPADELARAHLMKKYWQFDWYTPMIDEEKLGNSAWDGLYLLSVLSPKKKSWIGLL